MLVKGYYGHEQIIVYCFRGVCILGLAIAFSLAKDEILSHRGVRQVKEAHGRFSILGKPAGDDIL